MIKEFVAGCSAFRYKLEVPVFFATFERQAGIETVGKAVSA